MTEQEWLAAIPTLMIDDNPGGSCTSLNFDCSRLIVRVRIAPDDAEEVFLASW